MICPDCGFDNITGIDDCESCGQPLVVFDPSGGELEQSISRHTIGVLCTKDPLSIAPETKVAAAVATMCEQNVGCVLVIDASAKLVGIFTERDVLNRVTAGPDLLEHPVSDFMTSNPVAVSHDDTIAYAMHAMEIGGYRHLPIVDDDGKPLGLISVRDILRFLCVRYAELRTTQEVD